ncbi:MAG: hypothetical protein IPF47_10375 [Gemmatimonadetes bacterium]|nr:hypothetical protein [Gemmatimonadota bacterium]
MAHSALQSAPLSSAGSAVREQLRQVDDGAVVSAFLNGEERAFQELVDR